MKARLQSARAPRAPVNAAGRGWTNLERQRGSLGKPAASEKQIELDPADRRAREKLKERTASRAQCEQTQRAAQPLGGCAWR